MAHHNLYAVFMDIMGFADALDVLVDRELDALNSTLMADSGLLDVPPRAQELCRQYFAFHRYLDEFGHLVSVHLQEEPRNLIVFSDSAFYVTPYFNEATHLASSMMLRCLENDIPIRMGIGRGSFGRLGFATNARPNGSVIALAPFLGTSIVRAYRAQAAPAKGFRIFLHPTIAAIQPGSRLVRLQPDETSMWRSHELNFLAEDPVKADLLRSHVVGMRNKIDNPSVIEHYNGTLQAFERFIAISESGRS